MHHIRYICLVLLLILTTICAEADAAPPPLFVSLGCWCDVAAKLKDSHLRKEAYPFDWLLTANHDRFLELLNDDFRFFLNEHLMFQNPTHPSILENKYYEIEFRHDPPINPGDDLSSHLQGIAEKYARRINRFRQLREYDGKVFFIRIAYDAQNGSYYWWDDKQRRITAEQAKTLKITLDRFFPSLNFTLVIINYIEERVEKIIDINGVIEFKIRRKKASIDYAGVLNKLQKNSRSP